LKTLDERLDVLAPRVCAIVLEPREGDFGARVRTALREELLSLVRDVSKALGHAEIPPAVRDALGAS
jgi:hypothetical protein